MHEYKNMHNHRIVNILKSKISDSGITVHYIQDKSTPFQKEWISEYDLKKYWEFIDESCAIDFSKISDSKLNLHFKSLELKEKLIEIYGNIIPSTVSEYFLKSIIEYTTKSVETWKNEAELMEEEDYNSKVHGRRRLAKSRMSDE